jgi:ribosome-associated translation inhibitor RaiA
MQIEPRVTFHGVPVSDAIERLCLTEAGKLEKYSDRITSCSIVVSEPHRRHRNGNHFSIRIDRTLPGGEIVVNRDPPEHQADEDIVVAVREAFDTARRRLKDFIERRK